MSQAEELLNSLSAEGVVAADPQTEGHIIVDSNRFITVPDELKRIAVANDHNIETVTFECPRYWDDHDLMDMQFYINYKSPDESLGCYAVEDLKISPETQGNILYFDWTITRNVAKAEGKIVFLVCAKQVDKDGNEVLHWNSELCEDMYVSEGLECDNVIEEKYPDLYTQLLELINNVNTSYPDMYPKVKQLASDVEKNSASTKEVYDATKKIYDDLDKLGIGNGVLYTPNKYTNFYQHKIFTISSEVMGFKDHNGNVIKKLDLIDYALSECMIWQLGNYCRVVCRVRLNTSTFKYIWNSAGQMVETAKEGLKNYIIGVMNFRLYVLKNDYGIIVKPMIKNETNVGIVYASYEFIDIGTDVENPGAFLGKVNVPARMEWNKRDQAFEISLQDIGNFMYNPNYLYPNASESDEIHFPSFFTVDMTFPCEEVGSKVRIADLPQNYVEIIGTEISTQNNTMYSGGVE